MAAGQLSSSSEQLLATDHQRTGLLSYIRVGRPRRTTDYCSSPTISNPAGHYVWDFINWSLSTPHGLEALSNVTSNDKDIVPFSEMDQGRLFVRVSVQDLATLQLAYQRGLAALQKAQTTAERLREENNNLQAAIKGWSRKTTELTLETIQLRQEISTLRTKLRTGSVTIDEHKELIDLLCQNICHMMHGTTTSESWQASAFNDLLKLVFSLPVKLHEKLAHKCPNFNKLLNSTEPTSVVLTDAKTNIERILHLLPPEIESAVLEELIKKFNKRKTSEYYVTEGCVEDEPKSASKDDSVIESKRDDKADLSERGQSSTAPPRRYSMTEMSLIEVKEAHHIEEKDSSASAAASAIDRLDSLVLGGTECSSDEFSREANNTAGGKFAKDAADDSASSNENQDGVRSRSSAESDRSRDSSPRQAPVDPQVTINNNHSQDQNSKSSGMGTPLAHSTPFGTLSTLTSPKHQLNIKPPRKRRKRKVSRWNFAARFCSSGRSSTMSDSESMESAIYLQTARPQIKIIKHYGRQPKGCKWLFKINKH